MLVEKQQGSNQHFFSTCRLEKSAKLGLER